VRDERAVEQRASNRPTPDPVVNLRSPQHRLERNVAERVVEEMKGEVGLGGIGPFLRDQYTIRRLRLAWVHQDSNLGPAD